MNTILKVDNVTYWYPEKKEPAIRDVSLEVNEGEFVMLHGSSGSGKSTLCRMLCGLAPKYSGGRMKGTVTVAGLDTKSNPTTELSSAVGIVFQDPESQFVMDNVENEIAFGLENSRMNRKEISERIAWIAEKIGVQHLRGRRTSELSGGEKQKVILASVLALRPKVLVLDEPTSQLDPQARRELIQMIVRLNKEDGLTVIMVEHNVSEVVDYVDYVFDLGGKEKIEPTEFKKKMIGNVRGKKRKYAAGKVAVEAKTISKSLSGRLVLKSINLTIYEGECVAIVGRNGAGKTTLVKHLNGLLKSDEGSVAVFGTDASKTPVEEFARCVSYLPQNPSDMLFCDTVKEEAEFGLKHLGVEGDVDSMLRKFGLFEHKDDYPRDLSVGEKQRLALASILVSNPKMVVLDEPTRGIDMQSRITLMKLIASMLAERKTVVLVTQDMELASEVADRVIRLEEGRIADE